ncbi:hypothetical protein BH10ACI2_BH10ACI2_19860 [soil metagenome]
MTKRIKAKKVELEKAEAAEQVETVPVVETEPTDTVWLVCGGLIVAVAAFLRFFWLELKPLHHDEGVNGYFLTNLVRDGLYKYDPANYHGPTLYYIAYPFVKLFGLNTIPIRFSVAIFGVMTVFLALFLRRYIGRIGSLIAALFLALSPGMVFISRYFIHEITFVFFSLAIVVAVLFFIEKRKPGYFAIASLVLLLVVCFLPAALSLAAILGGDNASALWAFRIAFFIAESVLVYYIVGSLLNWDDGRPVYLILAAANAGLLFATKETAFITLGTMILACASVWVWRGIAQSAVWRKNWFNIVMGVNTLVIVVGLYYRDTVADGGKWLNENFIGNGKIQEPFVFYSLVFLIFAVIAAWVTFLLDLKRENESGLLEPVAITWSNFRQNLGDQRNLILTIAAVATAFVLINVVFFSSFFTYAEGISKAFEAYNIWTKTGNKDHTQNGWFGYLKWGMKVEGPIMILSALGALVALLKAKHRFAMFTAFWAFGLYAAYTIIPYKTPWLALSFFLPMCIVAGYGIGEMVATTNTRVRISAIVLAVAGTALLAYQTYDLNFVRYDDEDMAYVYAHTKRGFHDLIRDIDFYADKSGKGKEATIEIVSPDYWPMTWYLNKYSHANFHGSLVDASTSEMVVTKKNDQDAAAIQKYSTHYQYVGVYPLRPGVNLVLLVRKDLAEPDAKEVYKITEYQTIKGYTD